MIRVLHIFSIMNRGGAETMIMNVYRKIDRTKVQFDFLCMENEQGDYDEEIFKLGGRIFYIDSPSKSGYIQHIKNIINVSKKYGPYEVIHCPTLFHSGIACLAGYIAKIPIRISHAHNTRVASKGVIRALYQLICRNLIKIFATEKIACGEKARDFLFGKSKKMKKEVLVLKNGIDLEKYLNVTKEEIEQLKEELNIKDELIIGHVGRFAPVKNHLFFIELAKCYKKIGSKVKIVLAGKGELKEKIENEIRQNNLEEYFLLLGQRSDIDRIMNLIDVFVMPSLYEGFPMVIVEALASGKNCVVSNTISSEVQFIPNSVSFLDLNEDKDVWIKEIEIKAKQVINKIERAKILEENGFSVSKTTTLLENIYLQNIKDN